MIQPGQKLKEGDFCKNLTKVQFNQITTLSNLCYTTWTEHDEDTDVFYANSLVFNESKVSHGWVDLCKTKYDFPDFWQLCKNTFGV